MTLPKDHPRRFQLNDEVHARPPESLTPPVAISYLALVGEGRNGQDRLAVAELAERFGVSPPSEGAVHYSEDFGAFRLKWERHTEYSRIKVIVPAPDGRPFAKTAIEALPADWIAALPGETLVASHLLLLPAPKGAIDQDALAKSAFSGNWLIGAAISGNLAYAFTDFRIHADGFSRFVVYDKGLKPRQAGRTVQRLLEIDTYRMMALLAFPVARELAPRLSEQERELAQIANAQISSARRSGSEALSGPHGGTSEEPVLLDRLTRLQSAIESGHAETHYRFAAARAYHDLVQRRTAELREERLEGLQTFNEFTERRLMPAIQTCNAIASRQEELSRRVARATQLLSTRVDVVLERQNQEVLASMARRAKLQLRLQETVEGLSVAAVTYYVVGLVGYAAKALADIGVPLNPTIAMGLSIPIVAGAVWYGVRRVRQSVTKDDNGD